MGLVRTVDIIPKAGLADDVVDKITVSAVVPASDVFKHLVDDDYTIVEASFHNYSGGAYTGAGTIKHDAAAGGDLLVAVTSSDTLAADAVETKDPTANEAVADGRVLQLIAGDQTSFITCTLKRKVNA